MSLFFFNDTATTEIYTLSLHDALPILAAPTCAPCRRCSATPTSRRHRCTPTCRPPRSSGCTDSSTRERSEEHTSELQSRLHLVCRLLLEKKKACLQINSHWTASVR